MNLRPLSRPRAATNIARSSRALLAFAITAGVTLQASTFAASAQEDASVENYLADLVAKVTDKENQVATLEGEMGGLRESANKARVDLAARQQDAQDAQDKVVKAKGRLTDSDKELSKAQDRLDEIARSAYVQGGDAAPVNLAAGGSDAVADTLDRASYIRLATEKQRSEVDRLDLARTQTANEEAALRAQRNSADGAVSAAVEAYQTAADALANSQKLLQQKQDEYQRFKSETAAAQRRLQAARNAVDAYANTNPGASSFDKRRVAETAANGVSAEAPKTTVPAEEFAQQQSTSAAPEAPKTASSPQSQPEVTETTPAPQEQAGPEPSSVQEYAADPAVLPELSNVATEFAGSSEGDTERQQAIDGLLAAGRDAAMAGFTSYVTTGDQNAAIESALNAGRETAGQAYDSAMGQGTGAETDTGGADAVKDVVEPIQDAVNDAVLETELPEAESDIDTSGDAAAKIERVIDRAYSQLGVTYAWGGGNHYGPTLGIRDGGVADSYGDYAKVGFDCSGLMMYAFYAVGIELQHYSGYQYTAGKQVPVNQAKRGDMLFWGPGGSNHVALYLGDGQMIEAPQSGSQVKISPVRWGGIQPYAVRLIE